MNPYALDLGTKTGFAFRLTADKIVAGTWEFPFKKKGQNCCTVDPRLLLFREKLLFVIATMKPTHFVYEDVKFVRSQAQAHLWSGFRAVLWLVATDHKIPCLCVPVQTLKKYATDHGNADKNDMALALHEAVLKGEVTLDSMEALDDNAVDAVHLLLWTEAQFAS
jgi:Holliday junction resolvasome RuvABC endonuclease subunit